MLYRNSAIPLEEELVRIWDSPESAFYREKFAAAGLSKEDLSDPERFADIPFLTRAELESTPPGERLYCPEGDINFVAFTSGTTGTKPVITYHQLLDAYKYDPTLGVDVHRILVTYPPFNKNFGPMFVQMCAEAPRPVFPISADYQNLANSAVIAHETKPDALYATPTIAALLAPHLAEHYSTEAIRLVVLCSETLTAARREELARLYPYAVIANTYGSSEIGRHIFYPCEKMLAEGVSHFHPIYDDIAVTELIDNELVITYLKDPAFPLIRYRTGDYFDELPACTCGKEGPVLAWRGRKDVDRVRVGGIELHLEDIERAFLPLVPLIGDRYQVHVRTEKDGRPSLTVEVVLPDTGAPQDALRTQIARVVAALRIGSEATLGDAVRDGLVRAPVISFVPTLSVETTKARRLVAHDAA